ncbi:zinc-binding dehydrogenase [Candidatus Poribacteria bacterium]|nr:zinc-binding dehydrogenase [Candidatus Poribacteria bacterium]
MKQLTQNLKNGELTVEDIPVPVLKSGGVLVRNRYSLISAGTERMTLDLGQKSILDKARERPDLVKQVLEQVKRDGVLNTFRRVMDQMNMPIPLGYSSSGVVELVGEEVNGFKVGEKVACAGAGYANHAELVYVPKNLCVRLPEGVSLQDAAFTTLGSIALQGIRRAEPHLGDIVAVIGLGLIGQITVQLLQANGCRTIGIDINSEKIEIARQLGNENVINTEEAVDFCNDFSGEMGVDSVIISAATTDNSPIELAGQISRDKGRIVVVGAIGMDVPRGLYYKKELDLRLSRSYGPGRHDTNYEKKGIDYPIGYIRWTEKRNMEEFLRLVSEDKVKPKELITHIFDFEEAQKAYDIITGKTQEKYLAILLKYKINEELNSSIVIRSPDSVKTPKKVTSDRVNIGVIGAGNFARGILLPILKKQKSVDIKCIATATGLTAADAGKKFGCNYVTSDYKEMLNDDELDAIFVATRHNLHPVIAIEAIKKGKYVFVEKPLAISMEQLEEVMNIWESFNGNIMVGFNRRFSPFARRIKKFFHNRKFPLFINYRVNAGPTSKDSWVHDMEEGGGRILGEVCHFVDFIQYMIGLYPNQVYTDMLRRNGKTLENMDNISSILTFPDGSIGTINYLSNGDQRYPKERIEIFGGGSVYAIDDFISAEIVTNGKRKKFSGHQDKGHKTELTEFVAAVKNNTHVPEDFREAIAVTITTFKIIESAKSGLPENINISME